MVTKIFVCEAIKMAGGIAHVAITLGVTPRTVNRWIESNCIPIGWHAFTVAEMADVNAKDLVGMRNQKLCPQHEILQTYRGTVDAAVTSGGGAANVAKKLEVSQGVVCGWIAANAVTNAAAAVWLSQISDIPVNLLVGTVPQ